MTKKERAQVVELLRCCADSGISLTHTAMELGLGEWHAATAIGAKTDVCIGSASAPRHPSAMEEELEAALRIEQGEWP